MSTPVKVFSRTITPLHCKICNTCYRIIYGAGSSITFTQITPHIVSTLFASKPRVKYATSVRELFTEGVANLIRTSTTQWLCLFKMAACCRSIGRGTCACYNQRRWEKSSLLYYHVMPCYNTATEKYMFYRIVSDIGPIRLVYISMSDRQPKSSSVDL